MARPTLPIQGGDTDAWGTKLNTWLSKGGEVYNVVDGYGAAADGATDDSTEIQAAIDAATADGGGIVFLPRGTYLVTSSITLKSNVTLIGAGMNVTTIKAGAANFTTVGIDTGGSNMAIADLTVNGNRAGYPAGTGAALGGSGNVTDFRMSNVRVTNSQTFGVFMDTTSGGWTRGRISDCVFEDSGGGYDTVGGGQLTDYVFEGCIFRNTSGQGFASTNSTGGLILSGCHFEGPMGNGISLEPAQNVTIVGCTFHNLSDGAIAIRVVPVASIAADPKNIAITGNLIYNTGTVNGALTDYGIHLKNALGCLVTGNTILRMGRVGILLESGTITDSGNALKNVTVSGNVCQDSNQDNAGGTPNVLLQHGATTTLTNVVVVGNQLGKPNADSNATHGILETGTVDYGLYVGNDVRSVLTAGIGFGSGTTSKQALNLGYAAASYTTSNVTTDRSYNANSYTMDELADVLGTLIADLQASGLIG